MPEESRIVLNTGGDKLVVKADGSHGDSAEIFWDPNFPGSVVLKVEGPIALASESWEASKMVCEIRVTKRLMDKLAARWAKNGKVSELAKIAKPERKKRKKRS
jgi:hypothetical protein